MLFGLLTEGSAMNRQIRRRLIGLHLGGEQRLAQAVGELGEPAAPVRARTPRGSAAR